MGMEDPMLRMLKDMVASPSGAVRTAKKARAIRPSPITSPCTVPVFIICLLVKPGRPGSGVFFSFFT